MLHRSTERLSSVARDIERLCREILAAEVHSTSQDLLDAGLLDSLSLVQLILEMERHFQIELPLAELDLAIFKSVDAMARLIEERLASASPTSATAAANQSAS